MMNERILGNRTFIKRLLTSDASVFCFFRMDMNGNSSWDYKGLLEKYEKKYDTLQIIINRDKSYGGSLVFKLNDKNNEEFLYEFEFIEAKTDNILLDSIKQQLITEGCSSPTYGHSDFDNFEEQMWFRYLQQRPEIFTSQYGSRGLLDEEKIANLIDFSSFDQNFHYKFYTKDDFFKYPWENLWKESSYYSNNAAWKVFKKFGLIIKERWYSRKQSDFGFDHFLTHVSADTCFFDSNKKSFFRYYQPKDEFHMHKDFWPSVYKYYFGNKEIILDNFDDMPFCPTSNAWQSSRDYDFKDKLFEPPIKYQEDSFILSSKIKGDYLKNLIKDPNKGWAEI